MSSPDELTRDSGSYDVVVEQGETEATRRLRTDGYVRIGSWQAVGWEVLPDGRDGEHVSFAIKALRIAHPQHEVVLFEGEGCASTGVDVVDCLIPADAPVVVTVWLPAPRGLATNIRLHLTRRVE